MQTAAASDHRQSTRNQERKRVLMRGTIYGPTGAAVVWIRDISKDGAWIAGQNCVDSGSDVIFKRGPLFVAAHVTRADDSGAAIKFYRELSDHEVASAALPLPNRDD